MAGANIQSVFSLIDKFTGPARSIQASSAAMERRMNSMSRAAMMAGSHMKIAAAGMASFFAVHKLKEYAIAGAKDDHMAAQFDRMVDKAKDRIGVGKEELNKLLKGISQTGAFDMEQLQANVATPLIKSGYVKGENLTAAIRLAADMAAEAGGGEEAITAAGAKVNRMMGKRGVMMAFREFKLGTPEEAKELQKAAQFEKNLPGIQKRIILGMEKALGGAMEAFKDTDLTRINRFTLGINDFREAIGKVAMVGLGESVGDIGSAFTRASEEVERFRDALRDGFSINVTSMWENITQGSLKIQIALLGISALLGALAVKVLMVGLAFLGWPLLVGAAIAAVAAAVYLNWDNIKAYVKENPFTSMIIGIGAASAALGVLKLGIRGLLVALGPIGIMVSLASLAAWVYSDWDGMCGAMKSGWDSVKNSLADDSWIKGLMESMESMFAQMIRGYGVVKSEISEAYNAPINLDEAQHWSKVRKGDVAIPAAPTVPDTAAGFGIFDSIMNLFSSVESPKMLLSAEALAPLTVDPTKLDINNRVDGEINITIKDPGNLASVGTRSSGDVGLSVGKAGAGNYTSTNTAQPAVGR